MIINLKQETIKELEDNGKTISDICWVAVNGLEVSIADFLKESDKEYDNGYGISKVNSSLTVVGRDWWLERNEYDGAEWWEFKTYPERPEIMVSLPNNDAKIVQGGRMKDE